MNGKREDAVASPKLPGSLDKNRRLAQWLRFRADGSVEVHDLGQKAHN